MNRRARRSTAAVIALVVGTLVTAACVVPPPPPPPPARAVEYDFDGDGHADIAWTDTNGRWYKLGDPAPFFQPSFPGNNDIPASGDYDGNGRWEAAIVRGGDWITAGAAETIHYAAPPETGTKTGPAPLEIIPVPADYNGDGRTDPAWYRNSDATWWISGQPSPIQFGTPYHNHPIPDYDVPQPADYDGDGDDDIATYDPSTGNFKVMGVAIPIATGPKAGFPAPADYDGDGHADPAELHQYGTTPDVPVNQAPGLRYFIAGKPPLSPVPPALAQTSDAMPVPADYANAGHAQIAAVVNRFSGGSAPSWSIESAVTPIPSGIFPATVSAPTLVSALRLTFVYRCSYGVTFPCV